MDQNSLAVKTVKISDGRGGFVEVRPDTFAKAMVEQHGSGGMTPNVAAAMSAPVIAPGVSGNAKTLMGRTVPTEVYASDQVITPTTYTWTFANTSGADIEFQMFDALGLVNASSALPGTAIWNANPVAGVSGTFGQSSLFYLYNMPKSGVKFVVKSLKIISKGSAAGSIYSSGLFYYNAGITGNTQKTPLPLVQLPDAYQYNANIQTLPGSDGVLLVDQFFAIRGTCANNETLTFSLEIAMSNRADIYVR